MPSIISIGTKMVDRIAHLEVADVMKIFRKPVSSLCWPVIFARNSVKDSAYFMVHGADYP